MRKQAGLSLPERVEDFNARWRQGTPKGEQITLYQLRKIYGGMQITQQRVQPRVGRPKLESPQDQAMKLAGTMREVQHLIDQGYELLQLDESTFNANAYIDRAWAHMKKPLQRIRRYVLAKGVAVIGVISPVRGLVHCHYDWRSCNADSIQSVLVALRKVYDKGEKIAIFLDNARIHRAKKVQELARTPAVDIPLAYNQPYRCDLVGVEEYWRHVKIQYRRRLVYYKVNGIDFDHMALV